MIDFNKNGKDDIKEYLEKLDNHPPLYHMIGFTIFDIIHITIALISIISAIITKEEGYQLEISKELISLTFAVILIGFVDALSKKSEWENEKNRNFTYAWLLCIGSIVTPSLIEYPELLVSHEELAQVFDLIGDSIALLTFILLFSTLWMKKHTKHWYYIMHTVFALAIIISIVNIISLSLEAKGYILVLEIISSLAPIFPAIMSFRSFKHRKLWFKKETNKDNN